MTLLCVGAACSDSFGTEINQIIKMQVIAAFHNSIPRPTNRRSFVPAVDVPHGVYGPSTNMIQSSSIINLRFRVETDEEVNTRAFSETGQLHPRNEPIRLLFVTFDVVCVVRIDWGDLFAIIPFLSLARHLSLQPPQKNRPFPPSCLQLQYGTRARIQAVVDGKEFGLERRWPFEFASTVLLFPPEEITRCPRPSSRSSSNPTDTKRASLQFAVESDATTRLRGIQVVYDIPPKPQRRRPRPRSIPGTNDLDQPASFSISNAPKLQIYF